MPIPFLIAGAIAAIGTAVATSETCQRCDTAFWSSDCKNYCQDCCDIRKTEEKQRVEKEIEKERKALRLQEELDKKRILEERKIIKAQQKQKIKERKQKEKEEIKKVKKKELEAEKIRKERLLKGRADKKREIIFSEIISSFENDDLPKEIKKVKEESTVEVSAYKLAQFKKICCKKEEKITDEAFQKYIQIYMTSK